MQTIKHLILTTTITTFSSFMLLIMIKCVIHNDVIILLIVHMKKNRTWLTNFLTSSKFWGRTLLEPSIRSTRSMLADLQAEEEERDGDFAFSSRETWRKHFMISWEKVLSSIKMRKMPLLHKCLCHHIQTDIDPVSYIIKTVTFGNRWMFVSVSSCYRSRPAHGRRLPGDSSRSCHESPQEVTGSQAGFTGTPPPPPGGEENSTEDCSSLSLT